jgi:hypothetical protein
MRSQRWSGFVAAGAALAGAGVATGGAATVEPGAPEDTGRWRSPCGFGESRWGTADSAGVGDRDPALEAEVTAGNGGAEAIANAVGGGDGGAN